ncbi:MAG: hypothetical protein ACKV2V_04150 [Blastocatellia bacterium]
MPRPNDTLQTIARVADALNLLTVDDLKPLAALVSDNERPTRKADLVLLIESCLLGPLPRNLWKRMDDLQQNAIRETLYAPDGVFNSRRFLAKYGQLPRFGRSRYGYGSRATATLINLFLYNAGRYDRSLVIPVDLQRALRPFVTAPAPATLASREQIPDEYQLYKRSYDFNRKRDQDDDDNDAAVPPVDDDAPRSSSKYVRFIPTDTVPYETRETERAAPQELQTVLRLIDKGRLAASATTHMPSGASQTELAAQLRNSDFYPPMPKKHKWGQEIGPIRAIAWPLLAQAGKLATLQGSKLALTAQGRAALHAPPADTLKLLWERWLGNKLLDEFSRIDIIKGQQGKGKRYFTAPADRREIIRNALAHCPTGRWVRFSDFSRYMLAASLEFTVSRDLLSLYVGQLNYGHLGNLGDESWSVIETRYLACLLFEYAATLGMIDVAYVDPQVIPFTHELWGTDDLAFFSRYDGLQYFRLNPLGAYILGLTNTWTPVGIDVRARLRVMPGLQIHVSGAPLSPDEALLLETWAVREADDLWRLDRDRTLTALENGAKTADIQEFLAARDEQELPALVLAFFRDSERNARALKPKGGAQLIECANAELADLLATNERTRKLCLRAGDKNLVVRESDLAAFRRAAHLLGYGMPGG